MAENLKDTISDIVEKALREQDAHTFHGRATPDTLLPKTIELIMMQIEAANVVSEPVEAVLDTTGPIIRWSKNYDAVAMKYLEGPDWPEGWPLPRVSEYVTALDGDSLKIEGIEYFPQGEEPGDEPFIYVVAKKPRTSGSW